MVTAIIDSHPRLLRRKYGRDIILAVVLVTTALLGLSMCTNVSISYYITLETRWLNIYSLKRQYSIEQYRPFPDCQDAIQLFPVPLKMRE